MRKPYERDFLLTEHAANSIIAKYMFPATAVDCKPLTGGVFNSTYMLALSDGQRVVLRVAPEAQYLYSYERYLMPAEKLASHLCEEHGVPVPKVIAVDESLELIDRPYMLSAYISAESLNRIDRSVDQKMCYEDAGRALRQMHNIIGHSFGRLAYQINNKGFDTWSKAVLYEVQEWKKAAEPAGLLPKEYMSKIDSVFQTHTELLDQITLPRLVHGDLWSGNILASVEDGKCCFRALIDADHAIFGDPEYDLSGGMLNESFATGYGMQLKSYQEDREAYVRRKLYLLLYSMEQCYKYQYLHNDTKNSQRQREYIDRFLQEFT